MIDFISFDQSPSDPTKSSNAVLSPRLLLTYLIVCELTQFQIVVARLVRVEPGREVLSSVSLQV